MEIYLIRHTTPDIKKGICYGQSDIGVVESFYNEAACIKPFLPSDIELVYSSPLIRCRKLAEYLFPDHSIIFDHRLMEINCGDWEMRLWDEIDHPGLEKWMNDFVNVAIPGGESYVQLHDRIIDFFNSMPQKGKIAIVAHGGVLRSFLSFFKEVALSDSFKTFSLRYGCVVKVTKKDVGFEHEVLHNPETEKEQHRPSSTKQADAKP